MSSQISSIPVGGSKIVGARYTQFLQASGNLDIAVTFKANKSYRITMSGTKAGATVTTTPVSLGIVGSYTELTSVAGSKTTFTAGSQWANVLTVTPVGADANQAYTLSTAEQTGTQSVSYKLSTAALGAAYSSVDTIRFALTGAGSTFETIVIEELST